MNKNNCYAESIKLRILLILDLKKNVYFQQILFSLFVMLQENFVPNIFQRVKSFVCLSMKDQYEVYFNLIYRDYCKSQKP